MRGNSNSVMQQRLAEHKNSLKEYCKGIPSALSYIQRVSDINDYSMGWGSVSSNAVPIQTDLTWQGTSMVLYQTPSLLNGAAPTKYSVRQSSQCNVYDVFDITIQVSKVTTNDPLTTTNPFSVTPGVSGTAVYLTGTSQDQIVLGGSLPISQLMDANSGDDVLGVLIYIDGNEDTVLKLYGKGVFAGVVATETTIYNIVTPYLIRFKSTGSAFSVYVSDRHVTNLTLLSDFDAVWSGNKYPTILYGVNSFPSTVQSENSPELVMYASVSPPSNQILSTYNVGGLRFENNSVGRPVVTSIGTSSPNFFKISTHSVLGLNMPSTGTRQCIRLWGCNSIVDLFGIVFHTGAGVSTERPKGSNGSVYMFDDQMVVACGFGYAGSVSSRGGLFATGAVDNTGVPPVFFQANPGYGDYGVVVISMDFITYPNVISFTVDLVFAGTIVTRRVYTSPAIDLAASPISVGLFIVTKDSPVNFVSSEISSIYG
jgi:hypothetical protein